MAHVAHSNERNKQPKLADYVEMEFVNQAADMLSTHVNDNTSLRNTKRVSLYAFPNARYWKPNKLHIQKVSFCGAFTVNKDTL